MCHAISRIGRVRTRESTPLNMSFGLGYEIKPNVCSAPFITIAQLTSGYQMGFDDGLQL